jgi:hypothetical protein
MKPRDERSPVIYQSSARLELSSILCIDRSQFDIEIALHALSRERAARVHEKVKSRGRLGLACRASIVDKQ